MEPFSQRAHRVFHRNFQKFWGVPISIGTHIRNHQAKKYFQENSQRWETIEHVSKTISTGMDLCQYQLLHQYILKNGPKVVFEFGGGASTAVLAQAMAERAETHKESGVVYSFEDIPQYYEHTKSLIAQKHQEYCEVHLRTRFESKVKASNKTCWGFCYENLVDQSPDCMIVDGPFEAISETEPRGICLDAILTLAKNPHRNIDVFVEGKKKTVDAIKGLTNQMPQKFSFTDINFFKALKLTLKLETISRRQVHSPFFRQ